LKNLSLNIPKGKITAIVGASGSGKTTLIKLLLGFYNPAKGDIKIGNANLKNIHKKVGESNVVQCYKTGIFSLILLLIIFLKVMTIPITTKFNTLYTSLTSVTS
jgi:ABC-type transport system involved in cytochrome bd biosynthesis fused ATPase/permease subunit